VRPVEKEGASRQKPWIVGFSLPGPEPGLSCTTGPPSFALSFSSEPKSLILLITVVESGLRDVLVFDDQLEPDRFWKYWNFKFQLGSFFGPPHVDG